MKSRLMWLGWVMLVGPALAAGESQPKRVFSEKQLAQQQRMTDCSADAKEKALGAGERMAFMKTCLAGGQVTVEVGGEAMTVPGSRSVLLSEQAKSCDAEPGGALPEGGCVAQ